MAWNLASKVIDESDKPQVLRNGATILDRRETDDPNIDIVLAKKIHSDSPDCPFEYVTWIQNKEDAASGYDGTYYGHYFSGKDAWRQANADFWNRS
jgi:hypothetical protein